MKKIMKTQLIISFFLALMMSVLSLNSKGQSLEWVKQIGGESYEIVYSIAIDSVGNIYMTGYFGGTGDFDPGEGTYNLTSAGTSDIFISKLDLSGNFVWAKQMGGTESDQGFSIALDGSGNIYTTGYFGGTVDFDPGTGTHNLTSVGSSDIFISKLDASGNFVWVKHFGGALSNEGWSITVDESGNVYTTGRFSGTVDFDPGTGTHNLTSVGGSDIFISKLDASGNFMWVKQMGGTNNHNCVSIALDGSGNIYTTGFFRETVDFDPGAGVYNLTSAGSSDIFISKLDALGNFVWAKQFGGTSWDEGKSIAIDGLGNIYTTGYFGGSVDFDPGAGIFNLTSAGSSDVFISKLDTSGDFVWAKQLGGATLDNGFSIAIDSSQNVYTTGYFSGIGDFDPGAGIYNLTSEGSNDVFISKLDASGDFVWAKQLGGINLDQGSSIAISGSGNIYTAGFFHGTADFDPGATTYNLTSAGSTDIFVHKMSQPPLDINQYNVNSIKIYPNPSTNYITIVTELLGKQYIITNNIGKVIFQDTIKQKQIDIDLSYTPRGLYIITIEGQSYKLIKQ